MNELKTYLEQVVTNLDQILNVSAKNCKLDESGSSSGESITDA